MAGDQGITSQHELRDEKLLPLYTTYVQRITEHYKLGLQQFQVYFGFNAGLLALLGFIAKPRFEAMTQGDTRFAPYFLILIFSASIVGVVLTRYWRKVMENSKELQMLFNQTLEIWEHKLLATPEHGFYCRLNSRFPTSENPKDDLIDINVRVTQVFHWAWSVLGILSLAALAWPCVNRH